VTPVNDAPVAIDDAYATNEDVVLNVAAPGVLGNDTDADGDTLSAELMLPPSGTLTLNASGGFTYVPVADFNGSDSFTYRVSDDNGGMDTATVTITVTAVNDAPVAADDAYATNEDTFLIVAAPGVLGNDADVEGDPVTAVLDTDVSNGSLTLNSDGSFDYTPDVDFNGADSFTYLANDGTADSNVATVTITVNAVNDAPVAVDDAYTTPFETALNVAAPGVLGNDTDADGDTLTVVPGVGASNGFVTLNADGSFTYSPNAGFSGDDSFTYTAYDGTAVSNLATVTVTVGAPGVVDLDIKSFRATKRVSLSKTKPVNFRLAVRNAGEVDEPRLATVEGRIGSSLVYTTSIPVRDDVGDGTTTYIFDGYTPDTAGVIVWTVTIADDDPDVDEATAQTDVLASRRDGPF
jgi:VCBS repeat-containing protein